MSLEPFGESLWLAEGPIVNFYSFPYPTRMVVVRLADGGLWVWSPVALTEELRRDVDALGPVRHLVAPNKLHHLFLRDWLETYPRAQAWGEPAVVTKRADVPFAGTLGDTPPAAWAGELDQAWFRGSVLLNEVAFFHRASATAIVADLAQTFSESFLRAQWAGWQRWIARRWGITQGAGMAPLEVRLAFLNRRPARAAARKVIGWNPERVVMAHGVAQACQGRAYLERAFAWLDP